MREFLLSWSVGIGKNRHGGRKNSAAWVDVEEILLEARQCSGTVTVDIVLGQDVGPQSLQVQTENGLSVITLGIDAGDDYIVRSYSKKEAASGCVEILGNLWENQSVCVDFGVIVCVFMEFFNTGDVSVNWLR
ncbi:DUF6911 family protein [Ralstonia pseudosolanacearum]